MCGITGFIDFNKEIDFCESFGKRSLMALSLRGPDSQGSWFENFVFFGHSRLAVIDTNISANQPMHSFCKRYTIVFNGEIYNFQALREKLNYPFITKSDTETILAAYLQYGEKCLDEFRGMFAIAIWDNVKEELFVARDRLGVKPLFFHYENKKFAFASRPNALCELIPNFSKKIDFQALRYYLEAGYIPAPLSIYEGIYKLEPGHYLKVTNSSFVKHEYWSIDEMATDISLKSRSQDDLLDELDTLIQDSVNLRLVSDVPIGAFLSGGIDSSLVAHYMMSKTSEPTQTFTIGFTEKAFDESIFALDVANSIKSKHTSEKLEVNDLLELMPDFIKNYDEPFFDYSAFPVMAVSRLARKNVTVALSGDGGDEAFGGYHYYKIMNTLQYLHKIPFSIRKLIGKSISVIPHQRIRWLGHVISCKGPAEAYAFMRGVIKDAQHLVDSSVLNTTQSLAMLFEKRRLKLHKDLSYAEIGMRLDLAFTLPDDYLQKVDIGSMAFSLEAREPLLDHKIIEWAAKLPLCWKIKNGVNKYLLRELSYKYIPKEILNRPKMGFSVPMANWLRNDLKSWGDKLLSDDKVFEKLKLNAAEIRSLWKSHQNNEIQAHTILWTILVLIQFYNNNFEQKNEDFN